MNILIISNCTLNKNQGSGYVICGFAQGMVNRGHNVTAYGPDEFILFPNTKHLKRFRLFIGYTVKAITEVWRGKEYYNIVELWGGAGWLACLVLTKLRIGNYKVVSRSNGLEPHCRSIQDNLRQNFTLRRLLSKLENFTDGIGFRCADVLTVVSWYDAQFSIKKGYKNFKGLVMIENPLPNEWLQLPERKIDNPFTIGFVGSWIDRKGASKLVNIINNLSKLGSRCKWIIAGVGEGGKHELTDKTSLDPSLIFENVTRHELMALYQKMTVFLCLSSYESFGMVCSEAMACGCILLSTNVGFAYGLDDNRECVIINSQSDFGIANQIYRIEENFHLYNGISLRGQDRVKNLTWSLALDKLEQCYSEFFHKGTSNNQQDA